jgi:hypothetical protein
VLSDGFRDLLADGDGCEFAVVERAVGEVKPTAINGSLGVLIVVEGVSADAGSLGLNGIEFVSNFGVYPTMARDYLLEIGQQSGPFPQQQIDQMLQSGWFTGTGTLSRGGFR